MEPQLAFVFGDMVLDAERRELRSGSMLIPIEPQVFDLLEFLIRNRDRVVGRDDLIASIWRGRTVSDSAIAARINAVRRAVGDDGEQQRWIRTVARKGFRFVGDVREDVGSATPSSLAERSHPASSKSGNHVLPDDRRRQPSGGMCRQRYAPRVCSYIAYSSSVRLAEPHPGTAVAFPRRSIPAHSL